MPTIPTPKSLSFPTPLRMPWSPTSKSQQEPKYTLTPGPGSVTTRYFDPREQTRQLVRQLLLIFCLNVCALIALTGALYGFSTISDLNVHGQWDKRAFNALALLMSAMVSIGMGWLTNEIARMLRWPILARRPHKLDDVESILELGSLPAALNLVGRNLLHPSRRRRYSGSMWIVAAFLVVELASRAGVALFGLTFNVQDSPYLVQDYPIQATVWPEAHTNGTVYDTPASGLDFSDTMFGIFLVGLQAFAEEPGNNASKPDVGQNLQVKNMTQKFDRADPRAGVSYTYQMQNFNSSSGERSPSNRRITSHASCERLDPAYADYSVEPVFLDNSYPDGMLGLMNFPASMCFCGTGMPSRFIVNQQRQQDVTYIYPGQDKSSHSAWPTGLASGCGPRCSQMVFWTCGPEYDIMVRCNSTMSPLEVDDVDQPGSNDTDLVVSDTRARLFTSFMSLDSYAGPDDSLCSPAGLDGMATKANLLDSWNSTWGNSSCPVKAGTFDLATHNSSDGKETACVYQRDVFPQGRAFWVRRNETVGGNLTEITDAHQDPLFGDFNAPADELELWLAGLLARASAVTLAYMDTNRLMGEKTIVRGKIHQGTHSTLQVDWLWVWVVAGVLAGLQAVGIIWALVCCRNVVVKEDSSLVTGQVLQTISAEYRGASLASRRELIKDVGVDSEFIYGTVQSGNTYTIDIRRPGMYVKPVFPEGLYT